MCCNWIRKIAGTAACSGLLALSGCYSMNGYVMNASGLGYYEQGNYAMAAREFQTALASNPRNPDYMANLARTRRKVGDPAGAEQLYQQALALAPSHQPSYHGYSELLLQQGRSQEALRLMNTWAATQPYIAESHVELAWVQRELGQSDAAAQSLQTALQVNPNHATALAHLGQYYQESGDPTQAVAMYQQSLRADWNQPEVHSKLALAAEAAGPNHPMSEMAMARGVHPHRLPRQQMAFGGPPVPGPQFAAGPYPPMPQQQVAYQQPFAGQQQVTYQRPQMAGVNSAGSMPVPGPMMSGTFGPPTASAPMSSPMMTMPFGVGGVTSSPTTAPQVAADKPAPAPVPDPAFAGGNPASPSSLPVTSVSQNMEKDAAVPEVEAF